MHSDGVLSAKWGDLLNMTRSWTGEVLPIEWRVAKSPQVSPSTLTIIGDP